MFPPSQFPPRCAGSIQIPLSLWFLFVLFSPLILLPYYFMWRLTCFFGSWKPLPAFSGYPEGVVLHTEIFWCICGEKGNLHVFFLCYISWISYSLFQITFLGLICALKYMRIGVVIFKITNLQIWNFVYAIMVQSESIGRATFIYFYRVKAFPLRW